MNGQFNRHYSYANRVNVRGNFTQRQQRMPPRFENKHNIRRSEPQHTNWNESDMKMVNSRVNQINRYDKNQNTPRTPMMTPRRLNQTPRAQIMRQNFQRNFQHPGQPTQSPMIRQFQQQKPTRNA